MKAVQDMRMVRIGHHKFMPAPVKPTRRQMEILSLIADGFTSPEIAAILGITRKTVTNHREQMAQRLNLTGNLCLIRFAGTFRCANMLTEWRVNNPKAKRHERISSVRLSGLPRPIHARDGCT